MSTIPGVSSAAAADSARRAAEAARLRQIEEVARAALERLSQGQQASAFENARITAAQDASGITSGQGVSLETLKVAFPTAPEEKLRALQPAINRTLQEFNINTPEKVAGFLATLGHESGDLRHTQEIGQGGGRYQDANGHSYHGRGYIQLTHKSNYAEAGKDLGLDLVNNPDLAADPDNALRIAGWFYEKRGCNEKAAAGNFSGDNGVCETVNGGTNGLADRQERYNRIAAHLGGKLDTGVPIGKEGAQIAGKWGEGGRSSWGDSNGSHSTGGASGSSGASSDVTDQMWEMHRNNQATISDDEKGALKKLTWMDLVKMGLIPPPKPGQEAAYEGTVFTDAEVEAMAADPSKVPPEVRSLLAAQKVFGQAEAQGVDLSKLQGVEAQRFVQDALGLTHVPTPAETGIVVP